MAKKDQIQWIILDTGHVSQKYLKYFDKTAVDQSLGQINLLKNMENKVFIETETYMDISPAALDSHCLVHLNNNLFLLEGFLNGILE